MSIFEALLQHDHVPNFYRVENTRSAPKLEDVAAETRRVMQESGTLEQLKPGKPEISAQLTSAKKTSKTELRRILRTMSKKQK